VSEAKSKTLELISILLGFVSIVNMVLLGIYIVRYCLALAFLGEKFLMEANMVGFATAISVALILYGCYLVYKSHFLRGGICNLIAGIITVGMYLYYTLRFHLLQQLGLLGYFLLLPAPISGIIGIIISKEKMKSKG
jgi:hypothetical protein